MNVGSVYFHKEFKFSDGTTGEKLFVVVNSPGKTENYLVCKTTSKEKPPHRLRKQGCSAEKNYFMLFPKDDWFNKDTWIQFDRIFEFETMKLLQDKFGDKAEYKADLKPKNIRAILKCILKSEDIPPIYSSSIKKTLNALQKDFKLT